MAPIVNGDSKPVATPVEPLSSQPKNVATAETLPSAVVSGPEDTTELPAVATATLALTTQLVPGARVAPVASVIVSPPDAPVSEPAQVVVASAASVMPAGSVVTKSAVVVDAVSVALVIVNVSVVLAGTGPESGAKAAASNGGAGGTLASGSKVTV